MRDNRVTVDRFQLKPVATRWHLLFNLLNFSYFRRSGFDDASSIESSPLFVLVIVPYLLFSEVYFFKQIRYFVTAENHIVGVLAMQETSDTFYISNLAVSPSYRRIGVATYMLNFSGQLARRLGKSSLELSVNKANTPALKLYLKQGFKKEGKRHRSYILRKDLKVAK